MYTNFYLDKGELIIHIHNPEMDFTDVDFDEFMALVDDAYHAYMENDYDTYEGIAELYHEEFPEAPALPDEIEFEPIEIDNRHFAFTVTNIHLLSEKIINDLLAEYLPGGNRLRFAFLDNNQWKIPRGGNHYTPESLNSFIHGVLSKHYEDQQHTFQLYVGGDAPQDFELAESPEVNCLIKSLLELFPSPDMTRKIRALDNQLKRDKVYKKEKYVNKEIANMIARKLKVRLVFKHQLGDWHDTYSTYKKKCKLLTLFAHDKHVGPYHEPDFQARQVAYTMKDDINKLYFGTHALKRPVVEYTKENNDIIPTITAFISNGVMYKSYRPPAPYDENSTYYNCTTELSFQYRKWATENRLRAPRGEFYDIIKSGTHFLTNRQLKPYDSNKPYPNYDMRKAFPSFSYHPLYKVYSLPKGNYNIFAVDHQEKALELIYSTAGWSSVTDIFFTNETIKDEQWIQNGRRYTNLRLRTIHENKWATFTITDTTVASSQDLKYPFKPLDDIREHKQFNNAFIGRGITGGKDDIIRTPYICRDPLEQEQLEFYCDQNNIDFVSYSYNGMLVVEQHTPNVSKKCLWHLNSYIMDYQQTTFMKAMVVAAAQSTIVAYNTDGFYTTSQVDLGELLGDYPHQFKYTLAPIKADFTTETPTHDKFEIQAPRLSAYWGRLDGVSMTVGPAGCKKSQTFFNEPLVNCIFGTPTHLLKAGHQTRTKRPVDTTHKVYGINSKLGTRYVDLYENIIVDEAGMHSVELMNEILTQHNIQNTNLYAISDIDPILGNQQLETSFGTPMDPDYVSANFTWYQQPIDLNDMRQGDPEDASFILSLRGKTYSQQIALLKKRLDVVDFDTAAELYDETSIGISAINKRCKQFNSRVHSRPEINFIKAKHIRNTRGVPKGSIINLSKQPIVNEIAGKIWFGRDKAEKKDDPTTKCPSDCDYEAAYMATCDAVQGGTYDHKIFIDLHQSDRKNFLYTAVSRCTKLDNVILIDSEITEPAKPKPTNVKITVKATRRVVIKK